MTRAVAAIVGSLFFSPVTAAAQGAVPAPRDACALLTPTEVSAALGVNVGAGTHPSANSPLICKWIVPGANEATAKFVMMAMETPLRFKYETAPMQGRITEPLAGVGAAAVYVDTPGFSPALSVKKGDSAFQIRVFHLPQVIRSRHRRRRWRSRSSPGFDRVGVVRPWLRTVRAEGVS